jgi:hypothetical protein
MEAIHIKAFTDDIGQIDAIKAFMKALKIKFEVSKEEKPYNPEFVAKILQGKKDIEEGRGITMSIDEFKELCK